MCGNQKVNASSLQSSATGFPGSFSPTDNSLFAQFSEKRLPKNANYRDSTVGGRQLTFFEMSLQFDSPQQTLAPAPLRFLNTATIREFLAGKVIYGACVSDGRSKKIIKTVDGDYHCPRCKKSANRFRYAYNLQIRLEDASNDVCMYVWVTGFDKVRHRKFTE